MPDEHSLTLPQVDLTRADFAAIADDLDFIKAQLALIPTRKELARTALGIIFGAAGLVMAIHDVVSRASRQSRSHASRSPFKASWWRGEQPVRPRFAA